MMKERKQKTYCRICEAHCGLEVTVNGDQVVRIRPDRDHPVSKGFACAKGLALGALHHDPDRLNYPQKRVVSKCQRITWAEANSEIGTKLNNIIREHGPRSVAMYSGNPGFFNFKNILVSSDFLKAFGSPNMFTSLSVDANNKFDVSALMYGLSTIHPIPDLKHTSFFMGLGCNPAVSQMSFIQVPNSMKRFKDIVARGGRVIFVDPVATETLNRVGEHISIRPGTDAYLLLAIGNVLIEDGLATTHNLDTHATGGDRFVEILKAWPPERVAGVTGIAADVVRDLARAYAKADSASLYISTGVNMGPFGSISYWLVQGLSLLTGNMDRQGGLVVSDGPFNALKLSAALGHGQSRAMSRIGGWKQVGGSFPVNLLAEEITCKGPDRIRALVVMAGNPIHSVPGNALKEAMSQLDLCVCIDIYPGETAQYADFLLPATDMLERSDYPLSHVVIQETPIAQYTQAVVQPKFERKEEWEILSDLAFAAKVPFGGKTAFNWPLYLNRWMSRLNRHLRLTPDTTLSMLLKSGGRVTRKKLLAQESGILLPPLTPNDFLKKKVFTKDKKVHLAPRQILDDIPRLESSLTALSNQAPDHLLLIGRRQKNSHNSWMHNNKKLKHPDTNLAWIHPADATRLGINDGDSVEIERDNNNLTLKTHVTSKIRQGVISIPHGWGHQNTPLSRANAQAGVNINHIIPGGPAHTEPGSGQAIMLAHEVRVRRC